jgi:hypothetical protein
MGSPIRPIVFTSRTTSLPPFARFEHERGLSVAYGVLRSSPRSACTRSLRVRAGRRETRFTISSIKVLQVVKGLHKVHREAGIQRFWCPSPRPM